MSKYKILLGSIEVRNRCITCATYTRGTRFKDVKFHTWSVPEDLSAEAGKVSLEDTVSLMRECVEDGIEVEGFKIISV